MKSSIKALILSTFILSASACTPMIDTHGDELDKEKINKLVIGKTTYPEVQQLLGSPSTKTLFDTENWIYLYSKQRRFAFLKPTEFERKIYVMKFDRSGILRGIITKDLNDGREIPINTDSTLSDEIEPSLLKQITDNFGRFGTEQSQVPTN
ncbi:MAG: outer membrane protein assembly factor BamE [Alphaproteobacteria bacterium]|nr:outer membrane protein assembly factor BamE [Alphaproteobacteria bacterium]